MDLSRGQLPKTRERRAPRIRARADEGIMTIKRQDSELRHPEAVAFFARIDGRAGGEAAAFESRA